MADEPIKKVDPVSGVDLNVKISEGPDGGLNVGYAAYISGTEKRFNPRPTHVVGMLVCAAIFVVMENFDSIKAELESKFSKKEGSKERG